MPALRKAQAGFGPQAVDVPEPGAPGSSQVSIHAGPPTALVRNRQQLRASHGSEHRTWERVVALPSRGPEAFRPMVTHRLPLARGLEGFELSRQSVAGKAILRP